MREEITIPGDLLTEDDRRIIATYTQRIVALYGDLSVIVKSQEHLAALASLLDMLHISRWQDSPEEKEGQ